MLVENTLKKVEDQLKKLRNTAINYKISFIIFMAIMLGKTILEMIPYIFKYRFSGSQGVMIGILFFLLLMIPIVLIPLNKFLLDKTTNAINLQLKRVFIEHEISKFNCELEHYPSVGFDQELFFKRNLISHVLKGAHSDDLMVGTINNQTLKISEYHVGGLFTRNFDGYVGIIFNTKNLPFTYVADDFKSKRNNTAVPTALLAVFKAKNALAFCLNDENGTMIFGVRGNKSMLEYSFSKIHLNQEKYKSDCDSFRTTLEIADQLTKVA
ncbi:MAG: hypothetical protein V4638_00115 [Bacteroidota bacterium]